MSNNSHTRTEYTIEVGNDPEFRDSYHLMVMGPYSSGNKYMTEERLAALQDAPADEYYRLVKRTVTTTDWEPA